MSQHSMGANSPCLEKPRMPRKETNTTGDQDDEVQAAGSTTSTNLIDDPEENGERKKLVELTERAENRTSLTGHKHQDPSQAQTGDQAAGSSRLHVCVCKQITENRALKDQFTAYKDSPKHRGDATKFCLYR